MNTRLGNFSVGLAACWIPMQTRFSSINTSQDPKNNPAIVDPAFRRTTIGRCNWVGTLIKLPP
jgi:hypothetical protein